MTSDNTPVPWYLRPPVIIVAIFVIGPFAIPLVWMSRQLSRWQKWVLTATLALLTAWLFAGGAAIYRTLENELADLQAVMK